MSKFIKIIINRKKHEFKNIWFLPQIINLYEKYSQFLHDDYFTQNQQTQVDAVINLIEKTSPYFWVIINKKTNDFAGYCYLDNWTGGNNTPHSAEITTAFKKEFWGEFTKKCATKFIKFCFKKYKLKKLKAYIFPQNSRVKTLLKKSGFKKEALLKAETIKNNKYQDIEVYSIIK